MIYNITQRGIGLVSQTVEHIIRSGFSICYVYIAIRRNHNFLSTCASWCARNDDRPDVPLFDRKYWSSSVCQYEREGKYSHSISKYRCYTALLALCYAYKLDHCLHTFCVSLRIAISPYLQRWLRRNIITHFENLLHQYPRRIQRISGSRNGNMYQSTIHLTIM